MATYDNNPGLTAGSGQYVRQIIKCLERAVSISGHRPFYIFSDWLDVVEAGLEQLPEHIKVAARTGQFAPDPPEMGERLAKIRLQYYDRADKIWQAFGEAFAVLLESSEPGLWGGGSYHWDDYGGPNIIGQAYMIWASTNPAWKGQYFTPWPVSLLMTRMLNAENGGEAEVHRRLKKALSHPDNPLGFATLLAGLANNTPEQARDWFLTRVIPAAMPYYEPITVQEPCVGSGVMLLAMASTYPDYAAQMGLVQFYGQDIDPQCVKMAKINCMLYGLNGYGLKLRQAVMEAMATRQEQTIFPKSAGAALQLATATRGRATQGKQQQKP